MGGGPTSVLLHVGVRSVLDEIRRHLQLVLRLQAHDILHDVGLGFALLIAQDVLVED